MDGIEELKKRFFNEGKTFSQWARDNGYDENKVHRLLCGIDKGRRGKTHEIAVKLGLKPDVSKSEK